MNDEVADLALAKKRMPNDFGWVGARVTIRNGSVFETLADRVEEDVRKYDPQRVSRRLDARVDRRGRAPS